MLMLNVLAISKMKFQNKRTSPVFSHVLEVEVANVKVGVANALPPPFYFRGGGGGRLCRGSRKKI